jgi:ribosomal protein S27AE
LKSRDTRGRKRCPQCGALVPARWFGRHLAQKHGSTAGTTAPQLAPQRNKKLRCPHCDKTFAVLSGLASHLHYLHPDKPGLARHGGPGSPQRKSAGATVPVVAAKLSTQAHPKTKEPTCPHCGKSFTAPHRLAQHIQYRHADRSPAAIAPPQSAGPNGSAAAPVAAPNASAEEHLKTALQELTQRQSDIEVQLARFETLRSEKDAITKQIDAVNAALQAFER